MLNGKTFAITGTTGRLGCETAARLETLGADVLPLVLNGYPQHPKRIPWTAGRDPIIVSDGGDLKNIKSPDYVIHFHWLVDRTLPFLDQLQYELNCALYRITYFWDWLKDTGCHRFANISSTKVYSHLNSNPISAETDPRPLSPYGLAKIAAERFLDAYFFECNFSIVHLRLCSVASYGEHPSQILSQMFNSAYKKKSIRVNTGHTMNLLYIDDAVDLIINAALHADKLTYVLAPPSIAVDEIATRFEKISGKKLNAEYIDLTPGIVDPVFQSDIIRLDARWIRRTALDSMIRKIIDYNLADSPISADLKAKCHSNAVDRPAYHGDKAYG